MTDRELMQMALDALEEAQDYTSCPTYSPSMTQQCATAAVALRARLAQPEPEPVAKMREMLDVQGRDGTWNYDPYFHGMYNGMEFMLAMVEFREPVFRSSPVKWLGYTAPPQREWKSLTDEEMREFEIWLDNDEEEHGWNPPENIVKYLEAKLKEKNQ